MDHTACLAERTLPAYYSKTYTSLLPDEEERVLTVAFPAGPAKAAIGLRGWNMATQTAPVEW